jgi:hypothetical protein
MRCAKRAICLAVIIASVNGCGGTGRGAEDASSKFSTQKPSVNPAIIAETYRAGKNLEAALGLGVNQPKFADLVSAFAVAISVATDEVKTDSERRVLALYQEALQICQDALTMWQYKIEEGVEGPLFAHKGDPRLPILIKYRLPVYENIPKGLFRAADADKDKDSAIFHPDVVIHELFQLATKAITNASKEYVLLKNGQFQ